VFLAQHLNTSESVAIKVTSKQEGDMEIVQTEVAALERIGDRHPNIAKMIEFFEDDEYTYLVLEYCSGGSLHDFLLQNGPVSERTASKWFRQLISAVAHCHANGVVSRDLKNANCLLDADHNIRLADFGLAALVDDVATDRLTEASGSAVFSAPEVYNARAEPYLGGPSEVWSLGAILHSMLARTLPFPVKGYRNSWHNYQPPVMISPRASELLLSVFQLNPEARPTLDQLLESPWLQRTSPAPTRIAMTRHACTTPSASVTCASDAPILSVCETVAKEIAVGA